MLVEPELLPLLEPVLPGVVLLSVLGVVVEPEVDELGLVELGGGVLGLVVLGELVPAVLGVSVLRRLQALKDSVAATAKMLASTRGR